MLIIDLKTAGVADLEEAAGEAAGFHPEDLTQTKDHIVFFTAKTPVTTLSVDRRHKKLSAECLKKKEGIAKLKSSIMSQLIKQITTHRVTQYHSAQSSSARINHSTIPLCFTHKPMLISNNSKSHISYPPLHYNIR